MTAPVSNLNLQRLAVLALFCVNLFLISHATAAPNTQDIDEAKARKVQAAFLINFIKFTKWPDEAFDNEDEPIVITIFGDDNLGTVVDALAQKAKKVHKRTIKVERLKAPQRVDFASADAYEQALQEAVDKLKKSQLVYMYELTTKQVDSVVKGLKDYPTLTVGTKRAMGEQGVMLSFAIEKGKVVFYANTDHIDDSDLKIDSKMLRLAKTIE